MNIKEYRNFSEFIMKLQHRVHLLLALPIIVFVFLFIRIENSQIHPYLINRDLRFITRNIIALITFSILIFAMIYFSIRLRKIRSNHKLRLKLNGYFSASLFRDSWLTVVLVIDLIGMGLTAERFYAIFFGVVLIVMLSGYPAHSRIINALKLNREESELAMSQDPID